VALEALKEDKTIRQIAIDEDIAAVPEKRGGDFQRHSTI
jgi:hypothetical protein